MAEGNLGHRTQKLGDDEIGKLTDYFNEMSQELQKTIGSLNTEIQERIKTEDALRRIHGDLVEASHRAGMAEVATDILHNVGNVLNSINVSVNVIKDRLSDSKIINLKRTTDLIQEHFDELGTFLSEDPQGKKHPGIPGENRRNHRRRTVQYDRGIFIGG